MSISDTVDFVTGYMPMLAFGSYIFSLNTAAYQNFNRDTGYTWASIERIGQDAARQFTGPGDDTIDLEGVVYPSFRGGGAQISKLRALAGSGLPQVVIDGIGNVYGRWVVTKITERQSYFAAFGQPRKQEFTISLLRFDGGPSNLLVSILNSADPGGLVSGAQQKLASAKSAASGIL